MPHIYVNVYSVQIDAWNYIVSDSYCLLYCSPFSLLCMSVVGPLEKIYIIGTLWAILNYNFGTCRLYLPKKRLDWAGFLISTSEVSKNRHPFCLLSAFHHLAMQVYNIGESCHTAP